MPKPPLPDSPRPVGELSAVTQDYLKQIWTAQEWSDVKVTTKSLADALGVSASTASEAIRKLADQGLVDHEKYGAVTLTDDGRAAATAMVRRHRLLETFLVSELGYGWDEVHDEAEALEHAASDGLIDRIDAALGRPAADPHGDPIPAADGSIRRPPAVPLSESSGRNRVVRVSDADPAVLARCRDLGIELGTVVDAHQVPDEVAAALWVTPTTG